MQNARNGMGSFARAQKFAAVLIELRTPLDEFFHALRAFGHQHFCGWAVNQSIAGGNGVLQMQRDLVTILNSNRDPALRVVRVRFGDGFLGDHQDGTVLRQLDCGAQACNPRPHYKIIRLLAPPHHFLRLTLRDGSRLRADEQSSPASAGSHCTHIYNSGR